MGKRKNTTPSHTSDPLPLKDALCVRIVADDTIGPSWLEDLEAFLERHQGKDGKYIHFVVEDRRIDFFGKKLLWDEIFQELHDLRTSENWLDSDIICLLTQRKNELNWFSGCDPSMRRNIFVQTSDWDWILTARTTHIVAHQIIENVLELVVSEVPRKNGKVGHEKPRGCINDFCERKIDFRIKFRTADICSECLEDLQEAGAQDGLLQQVANILAEVRLQAVNLAPYVETPTEPFEWPAPIAITMHRARNFRGDQDRLFRLLDEYDAIIRLLTCVTAAISGRPLDIVPRPSLGWWVERLQRFGKDSQTPAWIADVLRNVHHTSEKEKIVWQRNEKKGHGWLIPEGCSDSKEQASKLQKSIAIIERAAEPIFRRITLVTPDGDSCIQVTGGMRYCVAVQSISGTHVDWPREVLKLNHGIDPLQAGLDETQRGRVYTYDREDFRFYSLGEMLRIETCPACADERVLCTDGEKYIDTIKGHRVTLT